MSASAPGGRRRLRRWAPPALGAVVVLAAVRLAAPSLDPVGALPPAAAVPSAGAAAPAEETPSAADPHPAAGDRASFAVAFHGHVVPWRVFLLQAPPNESVTLEVRPPADALGAGPAARRDVPTGVYELRATAGRVRSRGPRTWTWTAPDAPRIHRLVLTRRRPPSRAARRTAGDGAGAAASGDGAGPAAADSIVLNAAVVRPLSTVRTERVRGYRIGRYPEEEYRDLPRYGEPRGLVRMPRRRRDLRVSPHFRLGQFPAARPQRWPKYLVLRPRLLLKLELLVERARDRGVPADGWRVLSGYRSPWYNRSIGQPRYSRHVYGDAADVYVDRDGDRRMDDLDGDGRVSIEDAGVLYDIVEAMDADPDLRPLVGGLGRYPANRVHGPFIHLDTRGFRARW